MIRGVAILVLALSVTACFSEETAMKSILSDAQELRAAATPEAEKDAVMRLWRSLGRARGVSVEVMAEVEGGAEMAFQSVSEPSTVRQLSMTFRSADQVETVGPWQPHDPRAYYQLFRE